MDTFKNFLYGNDRDEVTESDLDGHDYVFHRHETKETQDYLTKDWYQDDDDDYDDDDY